MYSDIFLNNIRIVLDAADIRVKNFESRYEIHFTEDKQITEQIPCFHRFAPQLMDIFSDFYAPSKIFSYFRNKFQEEIQT